MEKTFQINNLDVNLVHDKLVSVLTNSGFEIHRDEPRDNGFKLFVKKGEEHGEVELFNDWGTVRLITHGRLEWELMNIAEPLITSSQGVTMSQQFVPQQPLGQPQFQPPRPPMLQGMPQPTPQQPGYPQQVQRPQPTFQPNFMQGTLPEYQQLLSALMQSGYQIEVNTTSGQMFFIRGRKGNYVIDIEGRPQP
jgi:hypothetical protein